MAEAVLSLVLTKLSDLVTYEVQLVRGVKDKVRWLESELCWIKGFLKDADAKGKTDEMVKYWAIDVTEVAYQAEATIDTFVVKVRQSSGIINRLKARCYVSKEISKIKERLNNIKDRIIVYGIQRSREDGDALNLMPVRRRHFRPPPDDADVVGRFNDEKILLERLLKKGSCVISIVGLGGIGKTALARKLYRSNAVNNHFQKRIWLTVSQENSVKGLLKMMLVKVGGVGNNNLDSLEELELIDKINDSLRTQRFLIVLDDIWREDVCIWMKEIFRNVNNGSRVLITTRFLNVAKRADPTSTAYKLRVLNEDESLELLLKKAFPHDENPKANCSSELLDICCCLMRKCGGLPLALVVLGGLLEDKAPVEWSRVLETMNWEREGRECQEILALSYEDLPHYMKLCFLYFSAYPEDYEIYGTELIRNWVAEGFIPQEGNKTMEETGEAILKELAQRSLIHVNERKSNGNVKICGVHDLVRDFVISTADKDRFLKVCSAENHQPISASLSHRVAIHNLADKIDARHELRTLMVFGPVSFVWDRPIYSAMFRFQFLRVLDLTRVGPLARLPKEIKLMIHLRCLRLYAVIDDSSLPSSIGNFQFLQTIDIKYLPNILPFTIWKIKTLRHVLLTWETPPQSVKLEDLLTLNSVTFGSHETINWSFPNLRKFKVLINKEHHRAKLTQLLNELRHLISLHIKAEGGCHIEIKTTKDFPFHNTLQSLTLHGPWPMGNAISEFPIYLTKIELCGSELKEDPMPKLEMLQHLVTVKFFASVYFGKTMVCSAGGFLMLESLFIANWYDKKLMGVRMGEAMPNLEEWSIEEGAMPKLTFLRLTSCEKLKMLPDFRHVMSLQKLELYCMSKELIRRTRREDSHKIRHVPKICLCTGRGPGTCRDDTDEGEFSDAGEGISTVEKDDEEVGAEEED
ncbi:P-loop containing nucleoside triphosphate hydrolase protein [Dioscorea alata]|uniref:P-loop containing nucleoside triphosphate hydrolase protein n=1 Tax=Dioscorea alata TaxID=55571 RepID=A0ACB7WLX4_DIOAL|nr:P-loop containing nucleoside triphosphate hydrolase protein [Dioscorea alata]